MDGLAYKKDFLPILKGSSLVRFMSPGRQLDLSEGQVCHFVYADPEVPSRLQLLDAKSGHPVQVDELPEEARGPVEEYLSGRQRYVKL